MITASCTPPSAGAASAGAPAARERKKYQRIHPIRARPARKTASLSVDTGVGSWELGVGGWGTLRLCVFASLRPLLYPPPLFKAMGRQAAGREKETARLSPGGL